MKKKYVILSLVLILLFWWKMGPKEAHKKTSASSSTNQEFVSPIKAKGQVQNQKPLGKDTQKDTTKAANAIPISNRLPSSQPGSFEQGFRSKYPGTWQFHKDSRGQVFRIFGDTIGIGPHRESRDLGSVADTLAKLSGLESAHFTESRADLKTNATDSRILEQHYQKFPVHNGGIHFHIDSKSGTIFQIANNLKVVNHPDLRIMVGLAQAKEKVVNEIGSDNAKISKVLGPKIFTSDRNQELVWIVYVTDLRDGLKSMQYLIGASSGAVRSKSSVTRH